MTLETLIEKYPNNEHLQKLSEFASEIRVEVSEPSLNLPEYTTYEIIFEPKSYKSFSKFKKVFELTDKAFNLKNIVEDFINHNLYAASSLTFTFNPIIQINFEYDLINYSKFSGKFNNLEHYKIYPKISYNVFFKDEKSKNKTLERICKKILEVDWNEMLTKFHLKEKTVNRIFKTNVSF